MLCYVYYHVKGRNEDVMMLITKTPDLFTWEVAMAALESEIIPDDTRVKFCQLITCKLLPSTMGASSNN